MPNQRRPAAAGRAILLGFTLAMAAAAPRAEPSPPWMPDARTRHALQHLADEAGLALPLMQWPLPRAAVARALDALPGDLPPSLAASRDRVAAALADDARGAASLALRGRDETLAGFGDDATPGHSVAVRSPTFGPPALALRLGLRHDVDGPPTRQGDRVRLEGSALVTEALGVQWQAWSRRHWWGPGWQSSLLLGGNAPAFNGVGLQRAAAAPSSSRWLSWMGPWTLDLFVAQPDDALHSYLVGTRLALRPLPSLELGVSRTSQWGGRGRPQTVESFLRMLVGKGTNPDTVEQAQVDPANGMAGFDARLRCPAGLRCAGYAQLIGEDQAGVMPSRYLGLYGAEGWSGDGRHRWFAEFVETLCGAPFGRDPTRGCAYRNHAYPEGYTHAGRWIGAGAGPDSRLLTLGWMDAALGTSLRLHAGRIGSRIGVFAPAAGDPEHSGRVAGLGARRAWTWGPARLGAELDWLRIATPSGARHESRLGLSVTLPFGRAPRSAPVPGAEPA